MGKDGLKKEFEYLIMAKNHIWTIFLATSAGSLGLLFLSSSILKWALIILGVIFAVIFLDNYFRKDDKIENIIKKLKGED